MVSFVRVIDSYFGRVSEQVQPLYEHLFEELVFGEYVQCVVNVTAFVFVWVARVDDYVLVDLVVEFAV
jgi:hypothetical protein